MARMARRGQERRVRSPSLRLRIFSHTILRLRSPCPTTWQQGFPSRSQRRPQPPAARLTSSGVHSRPAARSGGSLHNAPPGSALTSGSAPDHAGKPTLRQGHSATQPQPPTRGTANPSSSPARLPRPLISEHPCPPGRQSPGRQPAHLRECAAYDCRRYGHIVTCLDHGLGGGVRER